MLDWKYRPKTDEERAAETEKKAQKEREKEEKPEGFASKNAKTITFTVMLVLFLAFLGPVSVFTVYRQISKAEENQGVEITEADVIELKRLGSSLTMDHLRYYRGVEGDGQHAITYLIRTDDFIIHAAQAKATGAIQVLLTDVETGDQIDVMTADVEGFFASH